MSIGHMAGQPAEERHALIAAFAFSVLRNDEEIVVMPSYANYKPFKEFMAAHRKESVRHRIVQQSEPERMGMFDRLRRFLRRYHDNVLEVAFICDTAGELQKLLSYAQGVFSCVISRKGQAIVSHVDWRLHYSVWSLGGATCTVPDDQLWILINPKESAIEMFSPHLQFTLASAVSSDASDGLKALITRGMPAQQI
jgi:hypothetical protein